MALTCAGEGSDTESSAGGYCAGHSVRLEWRLHVRPSRSTPPRRPSTDH
ncbi:hypothetical protein FM125_09230 [Micrococcus lylae]|uniref:Uncharacterized protein n=1 Tax=Micrococcus lylae TaxID=1273 RepID=A0A1R4JL70_9MICC|nr:hypothetical protein FM125_09230 [Micrococcus lylae]